jgi:hypothetical protein
MSEAYQEHVEKSLTWCPNASTVRIFVIMTGNMLTCTEGDQNIGSVRNELMALRKQITSLSEVAMSELTDEENLPLTEIHEELDEDGNIISKC